MIIVELVILASDTLDDIQDKDLLQTSLIIL